MEKEMKKLLLVAVSVGVFLLVTITVAIIYESGLHEVQLNFATVYADNHNIVVRNAKADSYVSVFDITGRTVAGAVVNNSEVRIPVAGSGIYIVRIGAQAVKVLCR